MNTVPDAQYVDSPRVTYWHPHMAGKFAESDIAFDPADVGGDFNLISSLCADGLHRPALDIDMPVVLVPSSTPDHWHLYLPEAKMTWENYERLINVLADVGIIGGGYAKKSLDRKMTRLRPPEVAKIVGSEDSDADVLDDTSTPPELPPDPLPDDDWEPF